VSNLSDLLPAGASAKQLTFTDSGSGIATKKPVILNSDGTVAEISETTDSAAVADLQTVNAYSGTTSYSRVCYATTEDRFVLAYSDSNNSSYVVYQVGTMSSGTITWTTPTVVDSNGSSSYIDIIYHSYTGKLVLTYAIGSEQIITIGEFGSSPYTTITWGSPSNALTTAAWFYATLAEWQGTDKFVLQATKLGGGYEGNARVGTISGSTYSMGTQITWTSAGIANLPSHQDMVYDTNIGDQMLLAYCIHSSSATNFATQVLTLSGTTVTSTTPQAVSTTTAGSDIIGLAWDTDLKQALLIYGEEPEDSYGIATSFVVVISTSSGSSTVNTAINFASVAGNQYAGLYRKGVVYDSSKKRFALTYLPSTLAQQMTEITVSGTTPSFSGTNIAVGAEAYSETVGSALDTNSGKMVVVCADKDNSNYVSSWVYTISGTSSNLTATNFVGVADSAISSSAAGSVIVQGGTVGGVNLGSGVSLGATSTVEAVDPVELRANGLNIYDSTNNKHIIVYIDAGASNEGSGAVGTISGTTVSYGTPVVFQSQNCEYLGGAYDSTNEKVLVCYRGYDTGQNFYLHGVVGTVSGTSISWGTPTALNSVSSYLTTQGVQFDSNTGKFLVCYQDGSANSAAAALVATVSGTSVSAGTPVTFDAPGSPGTFHHCASYDANAQKFLVTWTRQTNYYIYAAVATISGTSVSFGTTLNWYSATSYYQRVNYDSNAQKHLSVYNVSSGNGLGAAVATISGTDVTYGSGTTFVADTIASSYPEQTYDSTAQQMLIFANVGNSSPQPMIAYTGTISGTSVTVSSGTTILSGNNYLIGQSTYNSSANKTLVLWELSGTSLDSAVGTLGDLPLTVGTKYYVTTTGTFSSSADTPSVNAGLAISTTSLLLNGDS
jgi:hypothetical protein